jgi:hypothetical protein
MERVNSGYEASNNVLIGVAGVNVCPLMVAWGWLQGSGLRSEPEVGNSRLGINVGESGENECEGSEC